MSKDAAKSILLKGWFYPAVLSVAVLMAYAGAFSAPFIFDDYDRIVDDPNVRSLQTCMRDTTRPVIGLTLHMNYVISGYRAADFRLFNVGVHALCAMVLFALIRVTAHRHMRRPSGGATHFAFVVALLWALHPLQTQSVTYIIQRGETLMTLFYLVVIYAVQRSSYAQRQRAWLTLAVCACAAGMASKPVMATVPLVVLLYDRTFLCESWRDVWRKRTPLYLGLMATWAILAVLMTFSNESAGSSGVALVSLSPASYLLTQCGVILHYLRLSVWPFPQCFDYAWAPVSSISAALPALLTIVLVGCSALRLWLRGHALGFVWLAFFLVLSVTSSVYPIADIAVEHRMYLPLLAPILTFVSVGACLLKRLKRALGLQSPPWRLAAVYIVITVGLAGGLMRATIDRNQDYTSERRLWGSVVAARPDNMRAHVAFLQAMLKDGDFAAVEALGIAFATRIINEERSEIRRNRSMAQAGGYYYHTTLDAVGRAQLGQGRYAEAVATIRESLRAKPDYAPSHHNLALALSGLGQTPAAQASIERAVALDPDNAISLGLLGRFLRENGDHVAAIAWLEKASRLQPDLVVVQRDLAWLYATSRDDSVRDGARALALTRELRSMLSGESVSLYDLEAAALATLGEFDAAARALASGIALLRAEAPGDEKRLSAMQARLARYEAGRPYHE